MPLRFDDLNIRFPAASVPLHHGLGSTDRVGDRFTIHGDHPLFREHHATIGVIAALSMGRRISIRTICGNGFSNLPAPVGWLSSYRVHTSLRD
jgi:hypothetical protein